MNTRIALNVLAVAALAVASTSFAQRAGGGGGQRMGMMGGGAQSDAMLVNREDVQKELKLSTDQITKLNEARQGMFGGRAGGGAAGGNRNGGGGAGAGNGGGTRTGNGAAGAGAAGGQRQGFDPAQMEKAMKEYEAKVKEILTDEQETRLFQVGLWINGWNSIAREDVQKKLSMTAAQKQKVATLQQQSAEAMQALFGRVRNQEITMDDARGVMEKNQDTMAKELEKVLTAEQKENFNKMKGAKFTPAANAGGRAGGGAAGTGRGPGN